MAPRARSKFAAPKFEPEVFRKQMYCIEASTCDIVGTFRQSLRLFGAPIVIRRPKNCSPLAPLVTPLVLAPLLFLAYINWIDSQSRVDEGVSVGSCRINRLLFADNLVLLASSEHGLDYALDRFSATCDQAGMNISTEKTEVLCLSRKSVYATSKQQCIAGSGEVQILWCGIHE